MLFFCLAPTNFAHSVYTNFETVRKAVHFAEKFSVLEIFDLVRNGFVISKMRISCVA